MLWAPRRIFCAARRASSAGHDAPGFEPMTMTAAPRRRDCPSPFFPVVERLIHYGVIFTVVVVEGPVSDRLEEPAK